MPVIVTVISDEEGSDVLLSQVQEGLEILVDQLQIPDLVITIEDRFGKMNGVNIYAMHCLFIGEIRLVVFTHDK